ncbi:MAG: hypothetical protein WC438_03565 [Candidatus Pacearchaeota archaeon]
MKRGLSLILVSSIIILSVLPTILAYSYSWSPFNSWGYYTPSQLLDNEWFVFFIIFLIVFAFVYLSLSGMFRRNIKDKYHPWLHESEQNKGAIAVIAGAVALLAAAAVTRQGFISGYLGNTLTTWITLIAIIFVIVLSIPFHRKLSQYTGNGIALIIVGISVWILLKTINLNELTAYTLPYDIQNLYEIIISYPVIILVIIAGIAWAIAGRNKPTP